MDGAHPQDIGSVLDMEGVAIRTGHHCTMPLMERFHVPATARASLAIYNGEDDIDQLVTALMKVRSEEHTSELQSLMRISYAVFCLKKKTKTKPHKQYHDYRVQRSQEL